MHAIVNRDLPAAPDPFPGYAKLTKPSQTMLDLLSAGQITSFIIDAEVVALDKETGAFRTFQDLSNRAKKDVKVEDIKVIVGVFSFDLMLLNDEVI
jgi:DNA ligase-1